MSKKEKSNNSKKLVLVILLLLLLLIPISCTMFKVEKGDSHTSDKTGSYTEKKFDEEEEDSSDSNYSVTDGYINEGTFQVVKPEIDLEYTYAYRRDYSRDDRRYVTTNTNDTKTDNENYNDSSSILNPSPSIKDLEVELNYSTDSLTYKAVTVTITSNKELEPVDGWTLSNDRKILTKEYISNEEEVVTLKDIDGKTKNVTVSIKNISSNEEEKIGVDGEFKYIVLDSGEIQLTRYMGKKTALTIPAIYDGYRVYSVGNPNAGGATKAAERYNIFGEKTTTNTTIKSLCFEAGLRKIEIGAFNGCSSLTGNLIIPEGVDTIGAGAFTGCNRLNGGLVLPDSLKSIGTAAFGNCTRLKGDLVIPNNVVSIGKSAFANCSGFNGKLVLSDSLKTIEKQAFGNCTGLVGDIIIPNSVIYVGVGAFQGCSGFNGKLVLSNSLKVIEDYTFYGCNNLIGEVVIPEGVTSIGDSSFYYCGNLNGTLTLPNTLKSIGKYAFIECRKLIGDLTIPEGVTEIKYAAFNNCVGFNGNLTLPNTLEVIEDHAFSHCESFKNTSLTIPRSVKMIGASETEGTHNFYNFATKYIKEFKVEEGNNDFKAIDGVLFTKDATRLISYPASKVGSVYTIPEGVIILDQMAFSRAGSDYLANPSTRLKKIVLPDSLNVVRNNLNQLGNALYKYTGVYEIEVKDSNPRYKTIDGILYSKTGKTLWYVPTAKTGVITIEEGVESTQGAFIYGLAASTIYIPSTITSIQTNDLNTLKSLGKSKVIFAADSIYQFNANGDIVKSS